MYKWHGWAASDTGAALHIGRHPYRKRVTMMASIPGYGLVALGYFRTERDAALAMDLIDCLADQRPAAMTAAAARWREATQEAGGDA